MPKGGTGNGNANGQNSDFLAVAFMDADGNHKFSEKKGDALILSLTDTNLDGVVSAGDTIAFGDYFDFAGEKVGTFTAPDYVIQPNDTIERNADLNSLVVTTFSEGVALSRITWYDHPNLEGIDTLGINPTLGFESVFIDSINSASEDTLLANPAIGAPADPDTLIEPTFGAIGNGDQGFLDVFVA